MPTGLSVRLSLFYGALCLAIGFSLPYWPLWLEGRGLNATEIGFLISTGLMMRVFATPVIALLCDRWEATGGSRRRALVLLSIATLASYALFIPASGFVLLTAAYAVLMSFAPSLLPLIESQTLRADRAGLTTYGRVRLWGSITFILANLMGGVLIQRYGSPVILWAILGSCVVLVCAAGASPRLREVAEPQPVGGGWNWRQVTRLVRHPLFLVVIASAGAAQASHAAYYGFASLNWQRLGYDETIIGALWAWGVIVEIGLFALSARVLKRIGPLTLLAIGAGAGVVRWSVMAFDPPLALLFPLQALHALTYGATHLGAVHFISRAVPARLAVTGQALYGTIGSGVLMGIMTAFAGPAFARFEGAMFAAMALLAAPAFVGALYAAKRWDGSTLEAEARPAPVPAAGLDVTVRANPKGSADA